MNLLEVINLNKSYKNYSSELKRIFNWFFPIFPPVHEHVVLKDLNFKINSKEAIGLVGVNGAGKSTLLKILTGTLKPTSGEVSRYGKITAILELGMGFNPNLSGKQNAFQAAGLMGYSREEVESVIDEIEDFAEVGPFFDEPVRLYSSGMQMRVAFAVATAFRPDILIIDEALSVGDAYFQHKSFDKIKKFQEQGTTLLLVSHDKNAIMNFCSRVLFLNNGMILRDGSPQEVMDYYNAFIAEKDQRNSSQTLSETGKLITKSGTGEALIKKVSLINNFGRTTDTLIVGETACLKVEVAVQVDIPQLVFGVAIKNNYGQVIFGTNTFHTKQVEKGLKASEALDISFQFPVNLGIGNYSVSISLSGSDQHINSNFEWRDFAYIFSVINIDQIIFDGSSFLNTRINIKRNEDTSS